MALSELIVFRYAPLILKGLRVTFSISILGMLGGVAVGLIAAFARGSSKFGSNRIAAFYIEIARNTPALVSIMWFTYVLPQLTGISFDPYWTAWMALAFQTSGYLAEVFRAGIQSVDKNQRYAARSVGMTFVQEMRIIVLPQAFRTVIPDIMNQFVVVFKTSTLVSVVAVPDLMYQGHRLSAQLFQPIEIYSSIAIIYIVAVAILSYLVNIFEKKVATP